MSVSPHVDFVEDNKSDQMPPKVQGIRVILDAKTLKGNLVFLFDFEADVIVNFFFL